MNGGTLKQPKLLPLVLFSLVAAILSFLALFAGHKKGVLEDYHLITLNTSRIAVNAVNINLSGPLGKIGDKFEDKIDSEIDELATDWGLQDFYSAHLLDYCYGQYNQSQGGIRKTVTACSKPTAAYRFDPTAALKESLAKKGADKIADRLKDLKWPTDKIDDGMKVLHALQTAVIILYCVAIAFICLTFVATIWIVFDTRRRAAWTTALLAIMDFFAITLASIIVTILVTKGTNLVNKYGKDVHLEAHKGSRFLALTWTATALTGLTMLTSIFNIWHAHKHRKTSYVKHG